MIILVNGCALDTSPSMLQKAKQYAKENLGHKAIAVISFDSRLYELSKLTGNINDCIIIDEVHLIGTPVQKALSPIIKEASKEKDIMLLVNKQDTNDDKKDILVGLADKTIEIEPNESTLEYLKIKDMIED